MSAATGHPQKTELGLDELRRRTRGLSQRHRTMLLLVNGKRPRREVLALAGQAGVGVEFFDELVAMGMVDPAPQPDQTLNAQGRSADAIAERVFAASSEWPQTNPGLDSSIASQQERTLVVDPKPVVAAPAAVEAPKAAPSAAPVPLPVPSPPTPAPVLRSKLEPSKPPAASAPTAPPPAAAHKAAAVVHTAMASGPPRPKRAAPPVLNLDDAVPLAATRAPASKAAEPPTKPAAAAKAPAVRKEPHLSPGVDPGGARMRFSGPTAKPKAAARRAPPAELRQEPRLTPVKPPGRPARIKMLAPAGPLDDENEQLLLAEVRSLLIGTLLVDGPVTSSLTALRVRKARNRYDLTALVWEIERTLVRARRPREAQSRLSKARDLLGLGNTVVDEETSPGDHTRPGERTEPQR